MKKSHWYFRRVFQRINLVKDFIYRLVYGICSYPRMVIEMFTRVNMGRRYFSMASALTLALILFAIPFFASGFNATFSAVFADHGTWYIYLAFFLFAVARRRREIPSWEGVFDFQHFTMSPGHRHPKYDAFLRKIFGNVEQRTYECIIEALPFLLGGIALIFAHQLLGYLFIACSFCYSVSYMAAYYLTDNEVWDKIDNHIISEQMHAMFVEGRSTQYTKGVPFYGRRPASKQARQKLYQMMQEDEGVEVI